LEVAKALGQLHNLDSAEIGKITSENFIRLFQLESTGF
jgi:Tat protein secretion system quality control protein TatD with DNase activity